VKQPTAAPEGRASASTADRRLLLISVLVLVVTVVAIGPFVATRSATPAADAPSGAAPVSMPGGFRSPEQRTAALSTAEQILPAIDAIAGQVADCDEYRAERRSQINQHIAWIHDPDSIPGDILIAMGENPIARLVFGMGAYTSNEWRLAGRPAGSCLIPIGQALNGILVTVGETPFEEFAG
jgi:hypothetical protein